MDIRKFNLEANYDNITVAAIGTIMNKYPFPIIKFSDKVARISILSDDCVIAKVPNPTSQDDFEIKYCIPVVHYLDCSSNGKALSNKCDCKLMVLDQKDYEQVSLLKEINGTFDGVDILVYLEEGTDEIKISQLGLCVWQQDENTINQVTDYMNKNGGQLLDALIKPCKIAQVQQNVDSFSSDKPNTENQTQANLTAPTRNQAHDVRKSKVLDVYYKGQFVKQFNSVAEMASELNISKSRIYLAIRDGSNKAKGYTFEVVD